MNQPNPMDAHKSERPDVTDTPFVEFTLTRGVLTDNGATPWTTTIGVGTPPQPLRIMLDTGTVNTWVTASSCTTEACRLHTAFNPEASTTFVPGRQAPTSVSFGPWGSMGVVIGNDVCHLNYEHAGQRSLVPFAEPMSLYLAVSYEGQQFSELDCDGGFAIPSIPCKQPSALLEELKNQGLIRHAIASFWFDPVRGEGRCLLGALDQTLYDPTSVNCLALKPLEGELGYLWSVCLDQLQIGRCSIGKEIDFVLDTGSSVFKGGHAIIHRMIEAITDEGRRPTTVTSEADLSGYPMLDLTLGSVSYRLTPRQYFMQVGPAQWDLGVQYLEGLPDELLVVGSVFLDTVYSAFMLGDGDHVEPSVLLANAVQSQVSISGVWVNEFGSVMEIGPLEADGTFRGQYRSDTGATGVYPVMGVADPDPVGNSIAIAFTVNWRSLEGPPDPSWHWVSAFSGLMQIQDGAEVINTLYMLQQNATESVQPWQATAIYSSTFKRRP
ncbi:avidin/streptavidin family protein [Nitrincola alkalisediminis]|uniref:avidin/streptavidin family protein n=1 Tax=Nitrincola alkalisediminis TaxID=1366656 RepID=UPI0018736916|nr:avidin/streptavidin family protein [Nitrincola alkalisediminis]